MWSVVNNVHCADSSRDAFLCVEKKILNFSLKKIRSGLTVLFTRKKISSSLASEDFDSYLVERFLLDPDAQGSVFCSFPNLSNEDCDWTKEELISCFSICREKKLRES